jgi:hypothetical protein
MRWSLPVLLLSCFLITACSDSSNSAHLNDPKDDQERLNEPPTVCYPKEVLEEMNKAPRAKEPTGPN